MQHTNNQSKHLHFLTVFSSSKSEIPSQTRGFLGNKEEHTSKWMQDLRKILPNKNVAKHSGDTPRHYIFYRDNIFALRQKASKNATRFYQWQNGSVSSHSGWKPLWTHTNVCHWTVESSNSSYTQNKFLHYWAIWNNQKSTKFQKSSSTSWT